MLYFENSTLEFLGVPLAWMPYFSFPDPTAKRKTGFLPLTFSANSRFGVGITTPYYWALAPDYDATLTPMFTTKQGPLVQGEWRHRLVNGSYTIRASGIFQLDKDAYAGTPGDRSFRGDINSQGQFRLSDKWVFGWDGTLLTDKSYFQDYGFFKTANVNDLLKRRRTMSARKPISRAAARAASLICARCISMGSLSSMTKRNCRSCIQ